MASKTNTESESAIAQKTQEKFDFYLLSLVFTLLALSIQTAEFGISNISDMLEILGWILLIISGIAGLSRMEWVPLIRLKLGKKREFEDQIYKLKELQLERVSNLTVLDTMSEQPISERIINCQEAIEILDPHIVKMERTHFIKSDIHRYCFVVGIICIASSRAYLPINNIFKTMCL